MHPILAIFSCFLALLAPPARESPPRARTASEVLLVCNLNSEMSKRISDDYARKRHITNRIGIRCPDGAVNINQETIGFQDYKKLIEEPIRTYLVSHTKIDFIVLTKGVPIRARGASFGSCWEGSKDPPETRCSPSVDSCLAALDYTDQQGAHMISIAGSGAIGNGYLNRYWNAHEPFSHAKFGGYLVTRLDGYTEQDALNLTAEALAAEAGIDKILQEGKVLLDVQPAFGPGDPLTQPAPLPVQPIPQESAYSEFNADMVHASRVLEQRGIPVELDTTDVFIGDRSGLTGYFSWGSNDGKFQASAYESLKFAPGSLSDTAVSTSGRTFLPTQGGQSLLADLIAHGLTCGKGYIEEPLLQAIASPTIALDRYTSGFTMAESFYAASHFVAWEDVVIGDPLCSPYRHLKKRLSENR